MTDWKHILASIADDVEGHFDLLVGRLYQRMGWTRPVQIVPYLGYGTRNQIYLRGRVLEDRDITSARDNDTIWLNLLNMYKRFGSREVRGAQVLATIGGVEREFIADEEGYFEVRLNLPELLPEDRYWHDVSLELVGYPGQREPEEVRATGKVLAPPASAQFGIISDIDDTVVHTDAYHVLKMARNVFLNNSRTRLPFEGVAAFYKALQLGTAHTFNPIFYLSSSSWNIYDLLVDFFEVRGVPLGPLFLVDLGITDTQLISPSHHEHKLGNLQNILDTYKHLPFILIGDSGQKDPEIYLEAATANPGRILAIYIRDVSGAERDKQVTGFAGDARKIDTELILVKDTAAASLHATGKGFILPQTLPAISQERAEDQKEPSPIEKLLDLTPEEK